MQLYKGIIIMNSEISKLTMGTGRFCTTCYWTNCAVGLELLNYSTQPPATNQAAVIISFSNQSKYQTIHKLTFLGKRMQERRQTRG